MAKMQMQKPQGAPSRTGPESAAVSRSPSAVAPSRAEIAARAYEIWRESGCPQGDHDEHWYRAERELRARRRTGPENGTPQASRLR